MSESESQQVHNICIAFVQRRPNVQHCTNVIQMFCVCWSARFHSIGYMLKKETCEENQRGSQSRTRNELGHEKFGNKEGIMYLKRSPHYHNNKHKTFV